MKFFRKLNLGGSKAALKPYEYLWPEFLISIIGTIIGLVLTVGVTYYSEKSDKEQMARKIAMLTTHNLDVSIRSMNRMVDEMSRQDSVFRYVRHRYATSQPVSADTLQMFIAGFYTHKIRPIDSSTESVFSSDFDIWRNLDDPKVIGRIANCYSLMHKCGEEYERFETEKYRAFTALYDTLTPDSCSSEDSLAKAMLSRNAFTRIIESTPAEVTLLRQMLLNAQALNDHNKFQLGVSQQELDEIGKLL